MNSIWLPLLLRHIRSMPFLCKASRANSQNDSRILKLQSGEISKHDMLLREAYISACLAATCLLKAKCKRFPTNTLGIPGACSSTSLSQRSMPSKLHLLVIS